MAAVERIDLVREMAAIVDKYVILNLTMSSSVKYYILFFTSHWLDD